MEFKDIEKRIKRIDNSLVYYGCAIAGEVGELCHILKKIDSNGKIPENENLGYELADIFNYVCIIADKMGIDLEKAILEKIEIVNNRPHLSDLKYGEERVT